FSFLRRGMSPNLNLMTLDYTYLFYPGSISHLANINEEIIETNRFDLTGNLPSKEHEIVITEFLANTFKTCGYQFTDISEKTTKYTISSSSDLIGKTLTLTINNENIDYTITGILDTHIDTSRYEVLLDDGEHDDISSYYLLYELEILLNDSYHNLGYICSDEFNTLINDYNYYLTNNDNYNMDIMSPSTDEYYFTDCLYSYDDINKDEIIDFNNDGDVYLNYNVVKNIKIDKNTTLQNYIETNYNISNQTNYINTIKKVIIKYQDIIINSEFEISYCNYSKDNWEYHNILNKIAGVYNGSLDDEDYTYVVTNDFIEQYDIEKDGYASYILAPMCDNETLKSVISYTYDDGIDESNYTLNNQVMPMLETVNSVINILKGIFFYIAIGFAIFASVMFCNFITISITNKQHEIGILRAVGARRLDVLKIFLNESMMIALINWILATIVCFASVSYINNYIRDEFNVLVTILDFGIIQILLILLISIIVALIASALPVFRISKKKPIDAIKNRKS
ncbi:MAG: FtsX-like permease family protein, partial [Erysipelotrichaceae bacterium]|nr:FtsX-like permease family protein [Erysipelotrichaceae bacterium]